MNFKNMKVLVIISLIVAIIIVVVLMSLIIKKKREDEERRIDEEYPSDIREEDAITDDIYSVNNHSMFFTISDCINEYLTYLSVDVDEEAIVEEIEEGVPYQEETTASLLRYNK